MSLKKRENDETVFRSLVDAFSERLYWQVRRLVISHEDADDVTQEVWIKVYKSMHRFEGRSEWYTWISRIAINEALGFLRKKQRTVKLDPAEYAEHVIAKDIYFDGDEAQRRLIGAIHALPEKQRLTFVLRYFDDMKYADISELLGVSIGALKANYHLAVEKIKMNIKISQP